MHVFEKVKKWKASVEEADQVRESSLSWAILHRRSLGTASNTSAAEASSADDSGFYLGVRWFIRHRPQQWGSKPPDQHRQHGGKSEKQAVQVSDENEREGDFFRGGPGVRAQDRVWDPEGKSVLWRQQPECPGRAEEGKGPEPPPDSLAPAAGGGVGKGSVFAQRCAWLPKSSLKWPSLCTGESPREPFLIGAKWFHQDTSTVCPGEIFQDLSSPTYYPSSGQPVGLKPIR